MSECVICCDPLEGEIIYTCDQCKKFCHQKCWDKWMQQSNTCPWCRKIYFSKKRTVPKIEMIIEVSVGSLVLMIVSSLVTFTILMTRNYF